LGDIRSEDATFDPEGFRQACVQPHTANQPAELLALAVVKAEAIQTTDDRYLAGRSGVGSAVEVGDGD
jgi:hypothetical protein